MAKIAFIGLGNMGAPMALNLQNGGHEILGFDVVPATQASAKELGLKLANSNEEAVKDAQVAILMLPNGEIAKKVAKEILVKMKPKSLLIDCSTIDVSSAKSLHEMAKKADIYCLDAPVSGGVGGAQGGTLTFMVGGSKQAFTLGDPYFNIMGQKSVYCGDGGAGQSAKICNNMQLGISMVGACEAFSLAEKLGLSQSALFDVMSTSSGSCWAINTYCPVPEVGPKSPADNDYKAGFAAALMLKDMKLSQQAANDVASFTPLGEHAAKLYQQMVDEGDGETDFSGIIKFIKSGQNEGEKS